MSNKKKDHGTVRSPKDFQRKYLPSKSPRDGGQSERRESPKEFGRRVGGEIATKLRQIFPPE